MKFLIFLLFVSKLYVNRVSGLKKLNRENANITKDKVFNNLGSNNPYVTEDWFTQTLDHFNPIDTRTWKQRFQMNNQYYNASIGGPVFLFVGTESSIKSKIITESGWFDYAKEFGALCFQVEHRYYGKSFPTNDMKDENMKYLTTQQALADLAQFISEMNKRYKLTIETKWIAFGCSYGANLAAWLRLKYPHLLHGAICSNSILAAKVDYSDYYEIVSKVLKAYSKECVAAIKKGTAQVNKTLLSGNGKKVINEKFLLCDPLEESPDNSKDISNLYHQLARNFADAVQFYKTNCFGYYDFFNLKVDLLCNIMKNKTIGSALDRLAAVNSIVLSESNEHCLDYKYNKMIKSLKDSIINVSQDSNRSWEYQRCTEIGTFATSSSPPQIFGNGFPVNFYVQQCMDVFGPKFNSTFIQLAVDKTNMFYGGFDLEITRAVFVFGSIDPWHPPHIPKTLKPVLYLKGVAHCADMFPRSDKDPKELQAARQRISKYICKWLKV